VVFRLGRVLPEAKGSMLKANTWQRRSSRWPRQSSNNSRWRFSCATCKRLVEIGAEQNTTIVFPLPIDLITSMTQVMNGSKKIGSAAVEYSYSTPNG
jgi:hypothetical protein